MAKGFEWLSSARAANGVVLVILAMLGTSVWFSGQIQRDTEQILQRHTAALIAAPDQHSMESLAQEEGIRAVELLSEDRSEVLERVEEGVDRQVPEWFARLFLQRVPTEEVQPGEGQAPLRLIADAESALESVWPRWLGVMIGGGVVILLLLLLGSAPNRNVPSRANRRLLSEQALGSEADQTSPLEQRKRELGVAAETDSSVLEQLPERMADAVLVFDVHGTIQYANAQAHVLFEYHDEELVGRSVSRLVPPWVNGTPAEAFTGIPPSQQKGAWTDHEARRLTRRGQLIDVSIACMPLDESGNNLKGQVCVVRDISDLRRRMASFELVSSAVARFHEGVVIVESGADYRIVYANEAVARLLDTTAEALSGEALLPMFDRLDSSISDQLSHAAEAGEYGESWVELDGDEGKHVYHLSLAPIGGGDERSRVTHLAMVIRDFTELQTHYQTLEADQELIKRVMRDNPLAICVTNSDCEITDTNPAFEGLFGAGISRMLHELIPQSTLEPVREALNEVWEYRHYAQFMVSGEERVAEIKVMKLDEKCRALWFFNDVTERLTTARQLAAETERAKVTLGSIGDCVVTTNAQGLVDYINPVAEKLTGWKREDAPGLPVDQVVRFYDEESREAIPSPLGRALRLGRTLRVDRNALLRDVSGAEHGVQLTASPIRDRNGEIIGGVLTFHDVTEMRRTARALAYEARHDSLTGLFNKREFNVRLEDAFEQARGDGSEHVLAFLDLDHFKQVNDNAGHAAGDELLNQLTERIRSNLRKTDLMARLGGDEFGVLFYGCTLDNARQLCESVVQSVANFHFTWGNQEFRVGLSVGLVPLTGDAANLDQVVEQADEACYDAKSAGRNQVRVYAGAGSHGNQSDEWAMRLSKAVEEDGFVMYQQLARPSGGDPANGYRELLVRLQGADAEHVISPDVFMPAARRHGYVRAIDEWVVSYVFSWLATHQNLQERVGINLTVDSATAEGFPDFVLQQARRTGIDPNRIVFELSEPEVMARLSSVQVFIDRLHEQGFSFALQQFSFNRSSFECLKDLPMDYLKLDSSLTADLEGRGEPGRIMLESVVRIGHVAGLKVIATRVETPDLLQQLERFDFDAIQGFAIGHPEPIEVAPHRVH